MSRELREKADIVIKELKEILMPLSDEISRMKCREQDDSKENNSDY